MSSHAALAAATTLAIALNYNIGAEFTVTVTAGGEAAVDDVPFVNKGTQGFQMSQSFWTVSPLHARRRTVSRGSACK